MGNSWFNGYETFPAGYCELGIVSGAVATTDPESRDLTHVEWDDTPGPGEAWRGIGCAWRNTAWEAARVKVAWSGIWDHDTEAHHTEGAPLIHITPDSSRFAIGAYVASISGIAFMSIGYIGQPGELYEGIDGVAIAHTDEQTRMVELRTTGTEFTVWVDGTQLSLAINGTNPIPVPAELQGSARHGFGIDTHYMTAIASPTTPVVHAIEIRPN